MAPSATPPETTRWPAILCLSALSFLLVALEFMPATLLTPIARDLGVTDGRIGMAIAASALFAVLTSLSGAALLARWDRRGVVAGYTVVLTGSSVALALAPDFATFLAGRILVGIAVGGFWSLAVALMARLAAPADLARAIAALQVGTAIAFVTAPSLGSYLGAWIGWRGTFWLTVPIGCAALVWQMAVMPSLPPGTTGSVRGAARLLRRPVVALGLLAGGMAFMGQFALSIYFRPLLETVTGVSPAWLSLSLLILGLGGLAGTLLIGLVLRHGLNLTLVGIPVVLTGLALLVIPAAPVLATVLPLLAVWGVMTTPIPVIWGTWAARVVPDDLETLGGLQAAMIQLCIAAGALVGGLAYDGFGWQSACVLSAALSVLAAVLARATVRRA
jgi:predicted MFS family arabinose efflux permease